MSIKIFGCTFGREQLYLNPNRNKQGINPRNGSLNGLAVSRCIDRMQKTPQGYVSSRNPLKLLASIGRMVNLI